MPAARLALRCKSFRLEDHALARSAVHDYAKRGRKLQMAHAALFLDCGLRAEPLPVNGAFASIGVDREISDLEGSQVLKEMAALRGSNAEVVETGFNDGARPRDFVP